MKYLPRTVKPIRYVLSISPNEGDQGSAYEGETVEFSLGESNNKIQMVTHHQFDFAFTRSILRLDM